MRSRVAAAAAIAVLLSGLGARSAAAQSPGIRLSAARGNVWANPIGIGAFVDLDANRRLDVRFAFDAARGQRTERYCVCGASSDGIPLDPSAPRTIESRLLLREVLSGSLSLPVMILQRSGRELRLVPGVHVSSVSGTDHSTALGLQVGTELGLEMRFRPASTGRMEWLAALTTGRSTPVQFAVSDGSGGGTGSYVRLSLGTRFRLSMKEFTGLP